MTSSSEEIVEGPEGFTVYGRSFKSRKDAEDFKWLTDTHRDMEIKDPFADESFDPPYDLSTDPPKPVYPSSRPRSMSEVQAVSLFKTRQKLFPIWMILGFWVFPLIVAVYLFSLDAPILVTVFGYFVILQTVWVVGGILFWHCPACEMRIGGPWGQALGKLKKNDGRCPGCRTRLLHPTIESD